MSHCGTTSDRQYAHMHVDCAIIAGRPRRGEAQLITQDVDIVIVGTGMGGSTSALALAPTGASVLMLERGNFLPAEPQNWSPTANYAEHRYKNAELWQTPNGDTFTPGVHYYVGGNTKVYGAALPRFRSQDFEDIEHLEGISPAWPLDYGELEPFYARAEEIYRVHAIANEDPTDPPRRTRFPYPPVPHEPIVQQLSDAIAAQGLHPTHLPLGLDLRPGGLCVRCGTCDGYPCKVRAKSDAETCAALPALESPNVELWTDAYVDQLEIGTGGQAVTGVRGTRNGEPFLIHADTVVVACGAANSAALLLRSTSSDHPRGLGNSQDQVGRHYMAHNNTVLAGLHPLRKNSTTFQKTLVVNDFYGPLNVASPYPLGNLQIIGKMHEGTLKGARPRIPRAARTFITDRSVEWWVMSEDLPDPDNRVLLSPDGGIQVQWRPTNTRAHELLIREAKKMMRKAGYPFVAKQTMGIETNSHQCGTLRMGTNPKTSVVDPFQRVHGVENVYVVDSSVFPSSSASNPALTIAALSLRAMAHLSDRR